MSKRPESLITYMRATDVRFLDGKTKHSNAYLNNYQHRDHRLKCQLIPDWKDFDIINLQYGCKPRAEYEKEISELKSKLTQLELEKGVIYDARE